MQKIKRRNFVVFASGNGSTLQAIINAIENEILDAKINLVISDHEDAFALKRAEKSNIPTYIIKSKTTQDIDKELMPVLEKYDVDLIILAGYLRKIGEKVLSNYTIINTHPSLLPKYGGKGMYGMNVHRTVVENKEKESGVTVHFVNDEYDKGDIIWQTKVPVYPEDTPEDVSERVQSAEKTQLVSILKDFTKGKI